MNKQELVAAVAKRLGVTKAKATEIAEVFFASGGIIASELKRGGKVAITVALTSNVQPSGCELIAATVPILPVAPPRFSIITAFFSPASSRSATIRLAVSVAPAAG